MTDSDRIQDVVGRVESRIRLLAFLDTVSRAAVLGAAGFAGAIVARRLGWWDLTVTQALAVPAVVLLGSIVWHWLRRRPRRHEAASRLDSEYGLEDRVRTAIFLVDRAEATPIESAVISDAAAASAGVEPARVVAYRIPAWSPAMLGVLGLAMLAYSAPDRYFPGAEARAASESDVREAGKLLEARSLAAVDPEARTSESLRNIAKEQADLGVEFANETPDPSEALERLSTMEEKLNREADAAAKAGATVDETRRRMEKALNGAAGESAGDGEQTSEKSTSQMAREAAAELRAGDTSSSAEISEAARELAESLEKSGEVDAQLKEALDALEDGEVTAEEMEELAEALESLEAKAADREAAERLRAANRAAKQRAAGRAQVRSTEQGAGPYAGKGSTNDKQGERYDAEDAGSTMESSDARPDNKGEYEAKSESSRIDEQGYSSRVRGELSGSGSSTSLYVRSAPGSGHASTPYQQVYPQYRRSAERAIERSSVPADRRAVVKEYFESINPDRSRKP